MILAGGILSFLAALVWAAATGFAVASPLLRECTRGEKISWSFAAGLLLQAVLYAGLLTLRLAPGTVLIYAAGAAAALLGGLAARARSGGRRPAETPLPRLGAVPRALAIASAAAVAVFLIECLSEPLWQNDFFAIWGWKARTIFLSASVPARVFGDPAAAWSHPEYPLLLPLDFAALSAAAGSWNEHALALLFPATEALLLLALFGWLRRRSSAAGAAAAVFLTAIFFPLFQAPRAGAAEIPFAFALVLVSTAVLDRLAEGSGPAATGRVVLGSLLACGIKREGTLFVSILSLGLLALASRRRRRAPVTLFAALLLPAAANWAALWILRGPLRDRDFDLTWLRPARFEELARRIGSVFGFLLHAQVLPLLIPLGAVLLFFLLTSPRPADLLVPPLLLQLGLYASVCALSSSDPIWLAANSFSRIAGALFPAFALVLGDRWTGLGDTGTGAAGNDPC